MVPERPAVLRALGAVGLVVAAPWLSAAGPDAGAFGFPWPAFVPLILVPVLLVVLVRARDDDGGGGR